MEPQTQHTIGIHYWVFGIGGGERVTQALIQNFVNQGWRVILYTDVAPTPQDLPLPASVVRKKVPEERSSRPAFWEREAELEQLETLVYSTPLSETGAQDIDALERAGVPTICVSHCSVTYPADKSYGADLYDRLLGCVTRAHAVLCLSAADALMLRAYNPCSFAVINPVSSYLGSQAQAARERAGKRILWVGRFDAVEKRPDLALKVFAQVYAQVPEAELIMVGGGNPVLEQELKTQAQALGIAQAINFVGEVRNVRPYYEQADLYLQTSPSEGFPLALSEAYAAALPVLMFDLSYLTLVKACPEVRSAPWADTSALAAQAVELLDDNHKARAAYAQASAASAAAYHKLFSADAFARWNAVVKAVLEGQTPNEANLAAVTPSELEALLTPETPGVWRELLDAIAVAYERLQHDFAQARCDAAQQSERADSLQALLADKNYQVEVLTQKAADLECALADVWGSSSLRIGRAITALPRGLRDFLRRS